NTWENYTTELKEAGFVDAEVSRIISGILDVNSVNEQLIDEARKSFLTTRESQRNGSSSRPAEAPSTPSGEPAKSSESVPQDSKE
ncbi:MAG TPA: hypothetical protein VM260_19835, partial [Pirellula sp.]|nr:hypothetical protein [Pirellula sp.]